MGRPKRVSGHRSGTFPPPPIRPNQTGNRQELSSSQPPYTQASLPRYTIPIRQLEIPPPGVFPVVEPTYTIYTPSTTLSPISRRATLSPSSDSVTSGYTDALEHDRHMSPGAYTPTSSIASVSKRRRIHCPDNADEQAWYSTAVEAEYTLASGYQMTEELRGIDSRTSVQETSTHLYHNPRFLTPQDPSPTRHQRYPVTAGPWSALPFRHEDQYVKVGQNPPITMEIVQETPRSPQGRERGGGRTGPLSLSQRQQASDVRRKGACLRCTVMREKCESSYPCTNCKNKERRKFPKHCIPRDFEWSRHKPSLFPEELTCRLRTDRVRQHLANSSFALSRPHFKVPLDLHIGEYLYVNVQEFYPLESACEVRHAFNTFPSSDGTRSFGRTSHWNPPIVMLIGRGKSDDICSHVQKSLVEKFDRVLDDPKRFNTWTTEYFEDREEDFQTTILALLGEYYKKGIKEHYILRTCLRLLWFEYLLLHKFTIPPAGVDDLVANLDSGRPVGFLKEMHVIPDTINRFLKAIILPLAEEAAKEVTRDLHDLLLKMALYPNQSKATTDLALCLLFGLMIYLGRTHNALLLLANTPTAEIGESFTIGEAKNKIRDMEDKVSDYFLTFHRYALGRKSKMPTATNEGTSVFERHAIGFDLVGRLRKEVQEDYESERPQSFSVNDFRLDKFRYLNVRRLCWKVFINLEETGF